MSMSNIKALQTVETELNWCPNKSTAANAYPKVTAEIKRKHKTRSQKTVSEVCFVRKQHTNDGKSRADGRLLFGSRFHTKGEKHNEVSHVSGRLP